MFNSEILSNFSLQAAVIIPIVTAIVQAFKLWINDKYSPFVAMGVGIGITFLFANDVSGDLSGIILLGLLFGLASSGLYSGLVSTNQTIKEQKAERANKKQNKQQNQQQSQQQMQQPQTRMEHIEKTTIKEK